MNLEDEYKFLDQRVKESDGYQVQVAIDYLAESRKVLEGNTRELEEELRTFRRALDVFDWTDDPGGRAQISELNRRLQNYVTARMTLRDHTFAELKRLGLWKGSDWHRDIYQPKVDAVLKKDKFQFLQDLRNFVSHNRVIPIYAGIVGDERGEISQHISLDVQRLKKGTRWTAPSKRFLDEQDKKVDISRLIDDYKIAVDEFYTWLPSELVKAKRSEISATQKIWVEREQVRQRIDKRKAR